MTNPKQDQAAGPNGSELSDLLGLGAMLPACWAWQDINGDRQVNWLCKPDGEHEPLYRRAAIDRVLRHAREAVQTSEHMHARNDELRLLVSDMGSLMVRMVAGINHLAEIARQWEPDHSSGADRAGWVRATDAKAEAMKLLAELPGRIHRPNAIAQGRDACGASLAATGCAADDREEKC